MAKSLQLRWLDPNAPDLDVLTLADPPPNGPPNGRAHGIAHAAAAGVVFSGSRHEVLNALTAVAVAAGLLDDRWDDLSDIQRKDLANTVRRRAEQLRHLLVEG